MPAAVSTELTLYSAWLASGVRNAGFALRMGIPKSNVGRLFDLTQATRLDQLEAAFQTLGSRLTAQVSAA